MKLIYSREALADLVRLRAFIAENDPSAAARVAAALVKRVKLLRQFPQMGRIVEQATPPADVRDMVFGNYIVRYSVHTRAVAILRVWHHFENQNEATE